MSQIFVHFWEDVYLKIGQQSDLFADHFKQNFAPNSIVQI